MEPGSARKQELRFSTNWEAKEPYLSVGARTVRNQGNRDWNKAKGPRNRAW